MIAEIERLREALVKIKLYDIDSNYPNGALVSQLAAALQDCRGIAHEALGPFDE